MRRVLLLSTTTGYQTRAFGEAAERAGLEPVFATDRCHRLDDPWRDAAISVRFHDEDASTAAILDAATEQPIDGVLALGDRPTVIAARVAAALGLPGHPPDAAEASRNKLESRRRLQAAGLNAPWFTAAPLNADAGAVARTVHFPCVVKPLALSGSRGVIRANNAGEFREAFARLRRLLLSKDVRAMRDPANDILMIEGFIEGREFALEGLLDRAALRTLALFDKPDPLDGPFFEETIYVTPSRLPGAEQRRIEGAVNQAVAALGLFHGPIHAECRVNDRGAFVLEVAARPIGGLCARALRFTRGPAEPITLEELLVRHAAGECVTEYVREPHASGVMMAPIPREGIYRRVDGTDEALAVGGVEEIRITAKPDQKLVPLPEGASYLGFIFARAQTPAEVDEALRAAHGRLRFAIDAPVPVL